MTTFISLLRTSFLTGKWLFYWFKLTTLTCPSVADFFTFPTSCSFHYSQWLTAFMNVLQIHFLLCEHLIWPVQIDPNGIYYHCRFYFCFFTYHPLQVLVFNHGWGHSLVSFRPHYWCLIGLFCQLKLTALTYPSFADSIFDILPFWPPVAPNTQQQPVVFISALYTSFLVYLYLFNPSKWPAFKPALPMHMLFSVLCLSDSLEFPMLDDGWQCFIKVFRTHH
jgi:hypothetical protein